MHQDNLPWLRKRRIIVTSDSDYGLPVYPTLARSAADVRLLAFQHRGGTELQIFDSASGNLLHTLAGNDFGISALASSPDGHILSSGASDG